MPSTTSSRISRRSFVARATALSAASLAAPGLVRSQPRELVVGAASSQKTWSDEIMIPAFEKKYNVKVVFEGTRSLVNLEKLQKNKGQQYLSLVQMDDPVMILAVKEGLLEPMTPAKVPNMASLKPGTVHMDGMWVNYLQPWVGIAYNKAKMPTPPTSWTEAFDPKYKGRVVLPSLQNTEGLANLFMAAFLATGKPMAEAQKEIDAGFKKLVTIKPNLLTAYTQMPQAYNLLEQGEAYMLAGSISTLALARKAKGAPKKAAEAGTAAAGAGAGGAAGRTCAVFVQPRGGGAAAHSIGQVARAGRGTGTCTTGQRPCAQGGQTAVAGVVPQVRGEELVDLPARRFGQLRQGRAMGRLDPAGLAAPVRQQGVIGGEGARQVAGVGLGRQHVGAPDQHRLLGGEAIAAPERPSYGQGMANRDHAADADSALFQHRPPHGQQHGGARILHQRE